MIVPSQGGPVGPSVRIQRGLAATGTRLLRTLPPERAHEIVMWSLKRGLNRFLDGRPHLPADLSFRTQVSGLGPFVHPVALAAGFDKNAEGLKGLSRMGFSAIEVGTVTPKAQDGNPKPRIFRQPGQRALVNRMGFNNHGLKTVLANLAEAKSFPDLPVLGVNLGKNRQTSADQALEDYLSGLRRVSGLKPSYFVVNISSPNTPGLRDLASRSFLQSLAEMIRRDESLDLSQVWIKLDPDQEKSQFQDITACISEEKFAGMVLTNTHRVEYPQQGGQSGHPLGIDSTRCLEWAWEVHKGLLPMIGSGGILSGSDIFQKMIRGASLTQIYTAMIYRGPYVVSMLLEELAYELRLRKISCLSDIVGAYYQDSLLGKG